MLPREFLKGIWSSTTLLLKKHSVAEIKPEQCYPVWAELGEKRMLLVEVCTGKGFFENN